MRHTLSLPFDSWPELDRSLWLETVEPAEEWLNQTRAAGWNSRTRAQAMQSYGRWLCWLQGYNRSYVYVSPEQRVVPNLVSRFVNDELIRVRAGTVSNLLFYLIGILHSFAPEQDWAWLHKLRSRVKRKASREPRIRPRLVPAQ